MDMGVMAQRLPPRVQHRDQADPGAEALGGERRERLGGRAHQEAVAGKRSRPRAGGRVKTTMEVGTGSSSARRAASHSARAAPWHFGQ